MIGLLFGFGEKNAYLFDWVSKNSLPVNSLTMVRFPELSRLRENGRLFHRINVTVEHLPIPYFASFQIYDENIERYAKEREKIVEFLQDKELIPFVLSQLH